MESVQRESAEGFEHAGGATRCHGRVYRESCIMFLILQGNGLVGVDRVDRVDISSQAIQQYNWNNRQFAVW
jgi:hypothetical protein